MNKSVSPMLPPAAIPSSGAFLTNAHMSSSNDTSLSTGLQTPSPCFLLQQLVWPMMTSTITTNPSSSVYLTSMLGMPSQPAFFIPMPLYGGAYPNNSSNCNSNNTSNNFQFAAHATAATQSPQLGMVIPTVYRFNRPSTICHYPCFVRHH